jgi:hypothetical protein
MLNYLGLVLVLSGSDLIMWMMKNLDVEDQGNEPWS